MAKCGPPRFITPFLTTPAKLYNLTTEEETLTGQPIEELQFVKNIQVKFDIDLKDAHQLFPAGQIPIGRFTAISGVQVSINQVLEIDNKFYRVIASNDARVKNTVYFFTLHMELFQHAPLP